MFAALVCLQVSFAQPFTVQGPGVNSNDFRITTFARGLDFPLGMAKLSDGSLLVDGLTNLDELAEETGGVEPPEHEGPHEAPRDRVGDRVFGLASLGDDVNVLAMGRASLVEIGFQVFLTEGGETFGAVHAVHPDELVIYVENSGDFIVNRDVIARVQQADVDGTWPAEGIRPRRPR